MYPNTTALSIKVPSTFFSPLFSEPIRFLDDTGTTGLISNYKESVYRIGGQNLEVQGSDHNLSNVREYLRVYGGQVKARVIVRIRMVHLLQNTESEGDSGVLIAPCCSCCCVVFPWLLCCSAPLYCFLLLLGAQSHHLPSISLWALFLRSFHI